MELKQKRTERNLTAKEVAVMCGLSEGGYSLIENEKRKPSVKTAKRIAEVLGFDWTMFFEEGERQ